MHNRFARSLKCLVYKIILYVTPCNHQHYNRCNIDLLAVAIADISRGAYKLLCTLCTIRHFSITVASGELLDGGEGRGSLGRREARIRKKGKRAKAWRDDEGLREAME